ncbi:MAG: hypothetical protein JSS27_00260 [Planctomycetes bacterium]|nr:hypothetical protein [Planctomycetota bacterium]
MKHPANSSALDPTADQESTAVSDGGGGASGVVERCPVIYADRVYLGTAGPRRVRVVCFSLDDRRALTNNAA